MSVQDDGLYLCLISVHGLIRGHNMELGRDADTGGQVKYVVELARALADLPEVAQVDLLTRQVIDPKVSPDYAQPEEVLSPKARIVRLPCGPRRYLRKEVLWPHLDAFTDQALQFIRRHGRVPDIIHSHYADAGYVGAQLAGLLGVPLVHTGHSLGRDKLQRLLARGMDRQRIEQQYNISRRIEAEEYTLDNAALVIASTRQEVEEQYQLYDNYQPKRMVVIPPGVELSRFHPPERGWRPPQHLEAELRRFLVDPKKPLILALSRADVRKNNRALVTAFGEHPHLREMANLLILLGNRDDYAGMERESREVINEFFHLVDRYDLYGHIAYPKHSDPNDIPDYYRLAARRRGVFVNPALTEPFGLTLIEAAASGLPVVATRNGGPVEIIANCNNGLLIDPLDSDGLGEALVEALSDRSRWNRWAKNGVKGAHEHYSWSGHARRYLKEIRRLIKPRPRLSPRPKSRLPTIDRLLVSDIDNTLIGDHNALQALLARLEEHDGRLGFAVATGRHIASARRILKEWGVPTPDIFITAVGTEIYYGPQKTADTAWQKLLDYRWDPDALRQALAHFPALRPQPKSEQGPYKISYLVDPERMPPLAEIRRHLRRHDLHANLVYSHQAYLDVLPTRASKGSAIRYIADRWGIPIDRTLVAGDSGNDLEMLRGNTLGVVVGNHSPELEILRRQPRIYFAQGHYAWGILEGIDHYRFLDEIRIPADRPEDEESELQPAP